MKKSLLHLPEHKRNELKLITRIIRDKFPDVKNMLRLMPVPLYLAQGFTLGSHFRRRANLVSQLKTND